MEEQIKIRIRNVKISDSIDILNWRNDPLTRSMSINSDIISLNNHNEWFERVINNSYNVSYIGILEKSKIGVCHFHLNSDEKIFEVSINLNPSMRGKGLGFQFLTKSIAQFSKLHRGRILARVKNFNISSLKLFNACGFKVVNSSNSITQFELDFDHANKNKDNLIFEKIKLSEMHISALYNLLKNRLYNISNKNIVEYHDHVQFVINNPYKIWYLISLNQKYVGSVYIKKNNSIGVDLKKGYTKYFSQVINFIVKKHKPLKEIKSVRPPYFYINISPKNNLLIKEIVKINFSHIQNTYKIY